MGQDLQWPHLKKIGLLENVEGYDEGQNSIDPKTRNRRDWKYSTKEMKMNYSWYVKDKYPNDPKSIYLYCGEFEYIESNYKPTGLVRHVFGVEYIHS